MLKKIQNENGIILPMTLIFMLAFTALGIGAIYHATQQSEFSERLKFSTQALWLADGGIERAKLVTTQPTVVNPTPLGNGTYNFSTESCTSNPDPQLASCICSYTTGSPPQPVYCTKRWKALSTGIVNLGSNAGQTRNIQAVISNQPMNAVTTKDGISGPGNNTPDCVPGGTADINGTCETIPTLSLLNYFGLAYSNDHASPANISVINTKKSPPDVLTVDHSYDGNNYGGQIYSGLTVITNDTNQYILASQITGTSAANPAFLIIDCADPNKCFKSTANESFYGIIWVIGNADMSGNPNITGSLFVQNGGLNGNLSGTNSITYDAQVIATTLENIGGVELLDPIIIAWKEI